jgi:hypothetical protein
LDLRSVQVHGDHVVCSSHRQEVCDESTTLPVSNEIATPRSSSLSLTLP